MPNYISIAGSFAGGVVHCGRLSNLGSGQIANHGRAGTILDAQFVERRDRADASIADRNVELAVSIACQLHELGEIASLLHFRADPCSVSSGSDDSIGQGLQPIRSASPQIQALRLVLPAELRMPRRSRCLRP
jgi:hypothetical protein